MLYPVYTETTHCRDCYKCVRTCPVKAIQVKDESAVIIKGRCIFCGKCVSVCPNSAKKIRSDLSKARMLLKTGRKVICSLAPSFAGEFPGQEQQLMSALISLGFYGISETSIGASIVSAVIDEYAKAHDGKCPWISTACSSVVELVKKYYPDSVDRLAKVPSPLQTHSAYLRHVYGNDIAIIFIGPCIAKKNEADETPGFPDVALTFSELKEWLKEEHIDLSAVEVKEKISFIPTKAGRSRYYPVERGMIVTSNLWGNAPFCEDAVALSGISELTAVLSQTSSDMPFLELLCCEGGCINGPAADRSNSLAKRKNAVISYAEESLRGAEIYVPEPEFVAEVLSKGYGILSTAQPVAERSFRPAFSEEEIQKALAILGKQNKSDELNCGGCGYNTCRDMAIAYLDGMAEPEMCVTKMRKDAQSKVDMLLRTIPNAVVIVDSELNIADCNLNFLRIFGDMDESMLEDSMLPLVQGLPLERFVPFYLKFQSEFYASSKNQYRLHYKDKFLRVTFFVVEKGRLLGAMFEDVTMPTVRRETVVKKAEDVIQKSLSTVQQIASLLGENAAETEIMLNSLIEAFSVHGDDGGAADGFSLDKDPDLV